MPGARPWIGRRLVAGSLLAALAAACAPSRTEDVVTDISAILGGAPDDAHDAVVLLYTGKAICSGTIVKKDVATKVGWVVTAAHCVKPDAPILAMQTRDFVVSGAKRFAVIDATYHPGFVNEPASGIFHDFAVVRVLGVDETTPVIPLAAGDDTLAVGAAVSSVGFGTTNPDPQAPLTNSKRNVVGKRVDRLTSDFVFYDQTDDTGICSGDSGGPVLVGAGERERVAGVHSYIQLPAGTDPSTPACNGISASGRVTNEAEFFQTELTRRLPDADSCAMCGAVAEVSGPRCVEARETCRQNEDCFGFNNCLATGGTLAGCAQAFPLGEGPYQAYASCTCADVRAACKPACAATDQRCAGVPRCGLAIEGASCASCAESGCCQEMADCAADGQCFACIKGHDADPRCAESELRRALASCTKSRCDAACRPKVEDGAASGDGDGPTAPGTSDLPPQDLTPNDPADAADRSVEWVWEEEEARCSVAIFGGRASRPAGWLGVAVALGALVAVRRRRA